MAPGDQWQRGEERADEGRPAWLDDPLGTRTDGRPGWPDGPPTGEIVPPPAPPAQPAQPAGPGGPGVAWPPGAGPPRATGPTPLPRGPGDLMPTRAPSRRGGGWIPPALVGALVGAVVAVATALALLAASDRYGRVEAPDDRSVALGGELLDVRGVLAAVRPGVVSINVEGTTVDQAGNVRQGQGAGSGMVLEPGTRGSASSTAMGLGTT